MAKFNFKEIEENIAFLQNGQKTAELKDNIRCKGILPILNDGRLFVYKISGSKELSELGKYYEDNMFDTYNELVLNDQKFKTDLLHSNCLPYFRNMINYRTTTPKEIWDMFNLNDEQSRKDFIEKNAQEVELHIPVDDTTYTKSYRRETIEEIVQRVSNNYAICTFKRKSKLSAIIHFIGNNNYFDLDFIASIICMFLNSNSVVFSTGTSILRREQIEIDRMPFTDKEKSLSEEEKMSIIKTIINALNIECVYCEEVNKISDFQLESIFGTTSRETVIDFSRHNNDILDNSDFSSIYCKIISSSSIALKKNSN